LEKKKALDGIGHLIRQYWTHGGILTANLDRNTDWDLSRQAKWKR